MRVMVVRPSRWEHPGDFPEFPKGTPVIVADEEDIDFFGWYACEIAGHKSYVPESFVSDGRLLRDYNPTELIQDVGDILEIQEIVYAWLYAMNSKGVTGWIPAERVISASKEKNEADKAALYRKLVYDVRLCTDCDAYTARGKKDKEAVKLEHDKNRRHINLWAEWQNSLNAEILLIGQDWSSLEQQGFTGEEYARHIENRIDRNELYCESYSSTDDTIIKHFRQSLCIDAERPNDKLFFTNSVQCYKTGSASNDTNDNWYTLCNQKYINRLIQIIQPKVIITLGGKALRGLLHCGGSFSDMQGTTLMESYFRKPINEIVDKGAILLHFADFVVTVCPVVHTGSREKYNRKGGDPAKDWREIKKHLR